MVGGAHPTFVTEALSVRVWRAWLRLLGLGLSCGLRDCGEWALVRDCVADKGAGETMNRPEGEAALCR